MKPTILALVCVALVGLQGCCKKSDASASGGPADTGAKPETTTVPLVETAKPPAQQRTYTMDWPGDGKTSYLRIKQIVVGPDTTTVTIQLNNKGRAAMSISTAPAGHKEAFYIQRADHKKRFKLLRAEGIPLSPTRINVPAGGTHQFTLVFELIEPTMTVFDVYEGDEQRAGPTYWNFSDVKLQ